MIFKGEISKEHKIDWKKLKSQKNLIALDDALLNLKFLLSKHLPIWLHQIFQNSSEKQICSFFEIANEKIENLRSFLIQHSSRKIEKWTTLLLHFEWKTLQNIAWLHDCILILHIAKVFSNEVLSFIANSPLLTLKTFFPFIIFKKGSWFLKHLLLSNIRVEEEFEFQFDLWKQKKNSQFSKLKEKKLSEMISPTSPKEEKKKEVLYSDEEDSFEGYSSADMDTASAILDPDSPSYLASTPFGEENDDQISRKELKGKF